LGKPVSIAIEKRELLGAIIFRREERINKGILEENYQCLLGITKKKPKQQNHMI